MTDHSEDDRIEPMDKQELDMLDMSAMIVASVVRGMDPVSYIANIGPMFAATRRAIHETQMVIEAAPAIKERPEPAVAIRASVKADYIVCLEDGKKLKTLKRYLRTQYNLTPEQYIARWGLPRDYPMVAPDYSEKRRKLAKAIGLGTKEARGEPPLPFDVPVRGRLKPPSL